MGSDMDRKRHKEMDNVPLLSKFSSCAVSGPRILSLFPTPQLSTQSLVTVF